MEYDQSRSIDSNIKAYRLNPWPLRKGYTELYWQSAAPLDDSLRSREPLGFTQQVSKMSPSSADLHPYLQTQEAERFAGILSKKVHDQPEAVTAVANTLSDLKTHPATSDKPLGVIVEIGDVEGDGIKLAEEAAQELCGYNWRDRFIVVDFETRTEIENNKISVEWLNKGKTDTEPALPSVVVFKNIKSADHVALDRILEAVRHGKYVDTEVDVHYDRTLLFFQDSNIKPQTIGFEYGSDVLRQKTYKMRALAEMKAVLPDDVLDQATLAPFFPQRNDIHVHKSSTKFPGLI